jgi:hypothetical protein
MDHGRLLVGVDNGTGVSDAFTPGSGNGVTSMTPASVSPDL